MDGAPVQHRHRASITELNNELTKLEGPTPRVVADALVRMLAPLVPHVAEELWERMGGEESVVYASFPEADPAYLTEETIELPVHVNGKSAARSWWPPMPRMRRSARPPWRIRR